MTMGGRGYIHTISQTLVMGMFLGPLRLLMKRTPANHLTQQLVQPTICTFFSIHSKVFFYAGISEASRIKGMTPQRGKR